MDSRTIAYVLAALMLVVARFALSRGDFPAQSPPDDRDLKENHASLWRLLLASFLVLFSELAFIRWIAVEVRVFAYFKNLALLLCFVGFGFGCVLARKAVRWSTGLTAFLGLVLVVRMPWSQPSLEALSQDLAASPDVLIW